MPETDHEKYMKRCLELASRAEGLTFPNPLVGSVIVSEGRIIGEGYHCRAGEPHAEVNAIASVKERSLIPSSVLYVSLEPCSHYGKTPPCANLILDEGIKKVVVGTIDTSDKVAGQGVALLRDSGVDVISGVLDDECRRINRRFFSFHEKKRPYITLKWAQSTDGFIDADRKPGYVTGPNWITGMPERTLVHKWRSEEEAILVGAGTIRTDNPSLNVRYWTGRDPLRIILSRTGKTGGYPGKNQTKGTVIVFSEVAGDINSKEKRRLLKKNVPAARQITEELYRMGIQSLLVEGGASVLNHFIAAGMWDEARIFTGKTCFGSGIEAPLIKGVNHGSARFKYSDLQIVLNDNNILDPIDILHNYI